METRGRKRQHEAEAAEACAPVETRAQKAARRARGGSLEPSPQNREKVASKRRASEPSALRRTKPRESKTEASKSLSKEDQSAPKEQEAPDQQPEVPPGQPEEQALQPEPAAEPNMDRRSRDALRRHLAEGLDDEDDHSDAFEKNASTLHGLLRKLGGAGIDDIFSAGMASTSQFKGILMHLKSEDDSTIMTGLTQLNDWLSVSMEDSLSMAPIDQIIPILVNLLHDSSSADILLLSARGLTYLADVMPASCGLIVRHDAIPVLCARLLNIEYMDVAEQALTALSKLAIEHAHALVREGALMACLSYVGFFEPPVQRIAVATAAQMCRGLSLEHLDSINSAVPILTSLLEFEDAKVVENASYSLTRIAEALQPRPQALASLCNQGLITNTLQLVAVSETGCMTTPLEVGTYFGLIKLLTTCVSGSAAVAETLHQAGASKIIHKLLSSSPLFSMPTVNASSILRTSDQLKEIISLTVALLPPLPDSATMILEDLPVVADLLAEGVNEGDADILARRRFMANNLQLLQTYNEDVLPLMLTVYQGTMVAQVKQKALQTIVKVLQYTPAEPLRALLKGVPISSFTAGLLTSQDLSTLASGLRVAELLQVKLQKDFSNMLLKEGVVHAIESLALEAPAAPSASLEKQKPKRASTRLKSKSGKNPGSSPEEAAPIQAPVPVKPPTSLRQSCAVRAQQFISKYYPSSSGGLSVETAGVVLLRGICSDLDNPDAIGQLLKALKDKDGGDVSTFEFLKSGTVESLRKYLLGQDLGVHERRGKLLRRLQGFCESAMQSSNMSGLQALIRKLQEGLSAEENFSISSTGIITTSSRYGRSSHSHRLGASDSLSQGLSALSQPFRLNLRRAEHESELADYGTNTVLIEPLATMVAVEDFLYPRIHRPNHRAENQQAVQASADPQAASKAPAGKTEGASQAAGGLKKEPDNNDEAAPDALRWESSGGRLNRKPASQVQPIPVPKAEKGDDNKTRSRITQAASLLRRALSPRESSAAPESPREPEPSAAPVEPALDAHSDEPMDEEEEYSEEDEEIDEDMADGMDEDNQLGMNQLQIHTVDLDEAAPNEDSDQAANQARGSAEPLPPEATGNGGATAGASRPSGRSALTTALQDRGGVGRSYAQAAGGAAEAGDGEGSPQGGRAGRRRLNAKLQFFVNNRAVPVNYTIFQAVNDLLRVQREEDSSTSGRGIRLWDLTHTIQYSRIENVPAQAGPSTNLNSEDESAASHTALSELLNVSVPADLEFSAQLKDIFLLLRLLEALNRLGGQLVRQQEGLEGKASASPHFIPLVPRDSLISHKLSPKLAAQLKDVLAICGGNIAPWIKETVVPFKFLFPFDLRRRYFYCTSSGVGRALNHLQTVHASEGANSGSEQRAGRVQRAKVRISRRRLMESAVKVMDMYAASQSILELEYFGEAGTGLGPTLEFYTILSHEMQKKGMGMWRGDHTEEITEKAAAVELEKPAEAIKPSEGVMPQLGPALPDKHAAKRLLYVSAPQGLFPAPLHPSNTHEAEKVLANFTLLGQTMAKALQDNRLMDIALSHTFYRAALGQQLDLYNIREMDSNLGISLEKFAAAYNCWIANSKQHPLTLDGQPIEDLCLTFELPGYPGYELKHNGSEIDVTADNLQEYVDAVVDATLRSGIKAQLDAFRSGFSQVMSLDSLKCFYPDELEAVLCGQGETWTTELLIEAIKFDHGYTANSTAVRYFVEILSELDAPDQRRFLRFITGSPRLRPGGLGALHPKLTVVRKHASSSKADIQPGSSVELLARSGSIVDGDLPSVMTCANYIKLPPYSSKSIMQARILYAIREGQGSFDLS